MPHRCVPFDVTHFIRLPRCQFVLSMNQFRHKYNLINVRIQQELQTHKCRRFASVEDSLRKDIRNEVWNGRMPKLDQATNGRNKLMAESS